MTAQAQTQAPAADDRHVRAFWLFLDTFLKLGTLLAWARLYLHLLLRPTRRTLALADAQPAAAAFRFLDTSLFLYLVGLGISAARQGAGSPYDELAAPLLLGTSWTIGLSLFYVFARRRATHGRTFAEFLELSALCLGFTLPVLTPFFVLPTEAAGLWALIALPLTSVYTVRVFKGFWGLSAKRVVLCMVGAWVSALALEIGAVGGVLLLVAPGLA
ncbi:MAG TPA: hypothetical protein VGJ77_08900 [Gaiellaceae bacterium]|jgi:hypothetical protein